MDLAADGRLDAAEWVRLLDPGGALVGVATIGVWVLATAPARGQGPQPTIKAAPIFANGMAQVVPAFQDSAQWIQQELWVETNFDSDHDGKPDRVHVDVTRPRQTETEGLKVSILYGASPYYAGTARGQVNWNVQQELNDQPQPRGLMTNPAYQATRSRISNALVNEWVPRGFAVVHSEQPGTGRSQGCPTVGDVPERMPMKFVVDWLNGRAKGYTTKTGIYGTDYVQRALIAAIGLGANRPEDAIYPTSTKSKDRVLARAYRGSENYVLTFPKDQMPPVRGFWSITMYNDKYFFVENPLNRYSISARQDLKANPDGSVDIYIQNKSPGADKESNWLPAPKGPFALVLRLYWPKPDALNGTWTSPKPEKV